MACKVKRNREGEIDKVLDSKNKESNLYNSILETPFTKSKQEALDLYKNIYAKNISENTPLTFKVGTQEFTNYKGALASRIPKNIEIGFNTEKGFVKIKEAPSHTDISTETGLINQAILKGLVSDRMTVSSNKPMFSYEGGTDIVKSVSATKFEEILGDHVIRRNGTAFEFINTDIVQKTEEVLSKIRTNYNAQLSKDERTYLLGALLNYASDVKQSPQASPVSIKPETLMLQMMDFLNKLGVSVTSISQYNTDHGIKTGNSADVNALADLTNRVIAIHEGSATLADFTEEVAHFAIAAYKDQAGVNEAIANAHTLPEWNEYSKAYYDIYKNNYEGEVLDRKVREEILGKALNNSFTNPTETPSFLRQIWDFFVNLIQSNKVADPRDFINRIRQDLIESNFNEAFMQDLNQSGAFYSAKSKYTDNSLKDIKQSLKDAKTQLENAYSKLRGSKDKLSDQFNKSIQTFNRQESTYAITNNILNNAILMNSTTNEILDKIKKNPDHLMENGEDQFRVDVMAQNLRPFLENLKTAIPLIKKLPDNYLTEKQWDDVLEKINNSLLNIGTLQNSSYRDRAKTVNEVAKNLGLNQSTIDELTNIASKVFKDITTFTKFIGFSNHSPSEIMQLLQALFSKAESSGYSDLNEQGRDMMENLKTDGFEFEKLVEDGGQYLVSETDRGKWIEARENAVRTSMENLLSEKEVEYFEKEFGKLNPDIFQGDENLLQAHEDNMTLWNIENSEQEFSKNFYKERLEENQKLHYATRRALGLFNSERAEFKKITENGRRMDKLSNIERAKWEDTQNRMKRLYSPYTATGELKNGITEIKEIEVNNVKLQLPVFGKEAELNRLDNEVSEIRKKLRELPEGLAKENLEDELSTKNNELYKLIDGKTSADLAQRRYNNVLKFAEEGSKMSDQFIDELQTLDKHEYFNFIDQNGEFVFNQEFYDNFLDTPINELVEENLDEFSIEKRAEVQAELDRYSKLNIRLKDIRKQYSKNGEVDMSHAYVPKTVREDYLTLERELSDVRRTLRKELRDINVDLPEFNLNSTPNRAFRRDLADVQKLGDSEVQFYIDNSIDPTRLSRLRSDLERVRDGELSPDSAYLNPLFPFLEESGMELNENSDIDEIFKAYAETKLASYYKRVVPEGYSEFLNELQNNPDLIIEMLEDKENLVKEFPVVDMLDYRPNYSWMESNIEAQQQNENWQEDTAVYGRVQPDKSKYRNDNYFDLFGINEQGEATQNENLFSDRQYFIDTYKKYYEMQDKSDFTPALMTPGVRPTQVERLKGVNPLYNDRDTVIQRLDNWFKDKTGYVADEKSRGEGTMENGVRIRRIPNLYTSRLAQAHTKDLLSSTMSLAEASLEYKYKQEIQPEVLKLMSAGKSIQFKDGKSYEESQLKQMVDEYVDAILYGIEEGSRIDFKIAGRTIDLVKVARNVNSMISSTNLGFSVPIAVTGFVTAALQTGIEASVNQFTSGQSTKKAIGLMNKMVGASFKDLGKIQKNGKLDNIMRLHGFQDITATFNNSKSNRLFKAMKNGNNRNVLEGAGFLGLAAGDYYIGGINLLSVMDDMRVVDGSFLGKRQFMNLPKNKGVSKAELNSQWNALADKNYFSMVTEDGTDFTQKAKDDYGIEKLKNWRRQVDMKAHNLKQATDTQVTKLERSRLHRMMLGSFTSMHRTYLLHAIQKRFKRRHFNIGTDMYEEGTYNSISRSIGSLIGDVVKATKDEGFQGLMSAASQWKQDLTTEELENFKRFGLDTLMLGVASIAAYLAAMGVDDEEEDTWGEYFAAYMATRVMSEIASVNELGLLYSTQSVLDNIVVGNSTLKTITDYSSYDFTNEIETGMYKGLSNAERSLIKTTWARHFYQLQNPQEMYRTFKNYNINSVWSYSALEASLDEEE